ncbi:Allophanate hydrolase subunit 2 [Peptoniphilus sp. ING2-D1G]|nr:Allophanate hydrolase subunit 2 [Peptoniphilus sp. ING2-D1G]
MAKISVINGGISTTIQDYGRIGYQKFGMVAAGVLDVYSYELANALVGNKRGEAVLEITYFGPMLKFDEDVVIAVAGADVSPKIDGKEVAMHASHLVKAGSTLSFGKLKNGLRAYLAFGGSIEVPELNGSKSTFMKGKVGGYEGRALKAKDEFEVKVNPEAKEGKILDPKYYPEIEKFNVIRVTLGPQDDYFSKEEIGKFFESGGYTVSKSIDRMGMRLEGNPIKHIKGADIISDGTVMGSIQVPANGLPIVLLADRQTTGGYTKIGAVIKEDVCKLAQMGAGTKLCFQEVSIEKAQDLYKKFEDKVVAVRESLK